MKTQSMMPTIVANLVLSNAVPHGARDILAEVDVDVGADLRHAAIEVAEVVQCCAISGDADLVEAVLEVGDRVGAVRDRRIRTGRTRRRPSAGRSLARRAARHCRRRRRG